MSNFSGMYLLHKERKSTQTKVAVGKTNYGIVPSKYSHFYLTELIKSYQVSSSKFLFPQKKCKSKGTIWSRKAIPPNHSIEFIITNRYYYYPIRTPKTSPILKNLKYLKTAMPIVEIARTSSFLLNMIKD